MKILLLSRLAPFLLMLPFLPTASCQKNEPVDEAKAAGKTITDFPQIAADVLSRWTAASHFQPMKSWAATPGTFGAAATNISGIMSRSADFPGRLVDSSEAGN